MSKEIQEQLSEEQLAQLRALSPTGDSYQKIQFPKIGMLAKDITEESGTGKNKKIDVINVAGEFYIEEKTDELNEKGKNIWTKTFFPEGETLEGIILYHRKTLKLWDDSTKSFTSTPLFDDVNEIVPLFEGGKEIARKTPKELQAMFPAVSAKGKPTSKLKELTVLYILINDVVYQWELSVSSGWVFSDYKKQFDPKTVVTAFNSREETVGSNTFRVSTFTRLKQITQEQFNDVLSKVISIKEAIQAEKDYYASIDTNVPVGGAINLDEWNPNLPAQAPLVLADGAEM